MALVALYLPGTGKRIGQPSIEVRKASESFSSCKSWTLISSSSPKRITIIFSGNRSSIMGSSGTIKMPSAFIPAVICILPWAIFSRLPKNSRWASPIRVTTEIWGLAILDKSSMSPMWSWPISRTIFSVSWGMWRTV